MQVNLQLEIFLKSRIHINKKLLKITGSLLEKLEDRNNAKATLKKYQQRVKKSGASEGKKQIVLQFHKSANNFP